MIKKINLISKRLPKETHVDQIWYLDFNDFIVKGDRDTWWIFEDIFLWLWDIKDCINHKKNRTKTLEYYNYYVRLEQAKRAICDSDALSNHLSEEEKEKVLNRYVELLDAILILVEEIKKSIERENQ